MKPDVVIHLAALVGVRNSIRYSEAYFETNITGTYNILKMCQKFRVKKLLFASSSSVYGEQKSPLNEKMDCYPISPYGFSKWAGEKLCKMFEDIMTIVFRPFTVYGENGREDMAVSRIVKAAKEGLTFVKYGDGTSERGYTNVHDLVDGIVRLLDYEQFSNNFDVFNLGGSETVSLSALIDMVKEKYPNLKVEEVEKNEADVFSSYASTAKAKYLVGWEPKRNFREELFKLLC